MQHHSFIHPVDSYVLIEHHLNSCQLLLGPTNNGEENTEKQSKLKSYKQTKINISENQTRESKRKRHLESHTHTHARTHARTHATTQSRTHVRTHAHTHTHRV